MRKSRERQGNSADDSRKVFVTNIDGAQPENAVEEELRRLFSKYGAINKLNVKKNKNGLYSFAFIEFQLAEEAGNSIRELDQYELFGKRMRVRQDRQSQGCFHCKKTGHFARECPQNRSPKQRDSDRRQNYGDRDRERNHDRYRQDRDGRREDRYERNDRNQRQYRDRAPPRVERYERRRSPSRSPSPSYNRDRNRDRHSRRRYYQDSRSRSFQRERTNRYDERRHGGSRYQQEERRQRRREEPRRHRNSSFSGSSPS